VSKNSINVQACDQKLAESHATVPLHRYHIKNDICAPGLQEAGVEKNKRWFFKVLVFWLKKQKLRKVDFFCFFYFLDI